MSPRQGGARRRPVRSGTDLHRAWLALVDADGPFLAVPPLKRVWPQGFRTLNERAQAALVDAKPAFERAWDAADTSASETSLDSYRTARDAWVRTIVTQVFGWDDLAQPSDDGWRLVTDDGELACQVWVVDKVANLREAPGDGDATPLVDRFEKRLRAGGPSVGVLTDGRWWALVSAPQGSLSASGIVDSLTWVEEPDVRDAFAGLLGLGQLISVPDADRLPELFKASVLAADEITEALGVQVRRAVELVVAALSDISVSARRRGLADPIPDDGDVVYEAVVTVLMRVVFLLFAQERDLLPAGALFEQGYGLAGALDLLDERGRHEGEEAMESTFEVWHRLLATSRALSVGASFEDLRLPPYGGSLFDPTRFAFLEARTERGALAVKVSDRVMLHVLAALQVARPKSSDARRISFRDIDVEQIGYIYEGLLGYTCRRVTQTIVGLHGRDGEEPEIPLAELAGIAADHDTADVRAQAILDWVKDDQPSAKPSTRSALAKALASSDLVTDAERALIAITPDADLRAELTTWLGAIRRDLRGRPVVILPGSLCVVETPSRKNAGAHYTPRELAEEVVEHAIDPLCFSPGPYDTDDRAAWRLKPSDDLLQLKIADIACGSGAFLVAAARHLAKHVQDAWHGEGRDVDASAEHTRVRAVREVVARCLYGVDINAMAVEMCKLSLWLVSLDAQQPFSFVDDKVLVGNSLLGLTDVRQLRALHIDPDAVAQAAILGTSGGDATRSLDIDAKLAKVRHLRRELTSVVTTKDATRSARAKAQQWEAVRTSEAELIDVADAVIAAGLPLGGKPGRKLNEAYDDLRVAVLDAYPASDDALFGAAPNRTLLDEILDGLEPTVSTDYERWQPLHWPIVLPDVFERGGFDAIIGNPPFLGGHKLTGAMGTTVRDWFVQVLAGGARGHADLVAYFLLRAFALLNRHGTLGLIATNTVAQGDTREVGLDRMVAGGFTITRAVQSKAWPSASANLEYAAVWGTRSTVSRKARLMANGRSVSVISTLLDEQTSASGVPQSLIENSSVAFGGMKIYGQGFILSPEEAGAWMAEDPRNREILLPYLNGEDVNSEPDHKAPRWVIDFNNRNEAEASTFARAFERVQSTVRAERQRVNRAYHRTHWWLYGDKRPALRKAIQDLDSVLVIAVVSKTVLPVRVRTGQVFSHRLAVFAVDDSSTLAILTSNVHWIWAVTYSSTLETRVNYSPTDAFETFPRPASTPELERLGEALDTERREIMLRRWLGLTKLYNLVNSPAVHDRDDADVARLRQLHAEIDHAVMAAYGWDDVPLDHGFHTYRQMERWTVSPAARVEILDRLLEENHRRAAAQPQEKRR